MKYLLVLLFLAGCGNFNEPGNLRACREACLPYGVKKYSSDGCECNKCPGEALKEEPVDD